MPRKIRLSVDLRLNGSPAAVAKAVELLADTLNDAGYLMDVDWTYTVGNQGITLCTLEAFRFAADVVAEEDDLGVYMVETDREDDED